jgi:hypothetical protein
MWLFISAMVLLCLVQSIAPLYILNCIEFGRVVVV